MVLIPRGPGWGDIQPQVIGWFDMKAVIIIGLNHISRYKYSIIDGN